MLGLLLRCGWRILLLLDFFGFTLLLYLSTWIPGVPGSSAFVWAFHRWCRAFVQALGIELHLHQHFQGQLPAQFVLIANHPSALEDIGIPALFSVRSLAKAEVQHWWILGRISWAAKTLYVQRDNARSRAQALQNITEALAQGDSLAIYPEGGCKGRRLHLPFQRGAFVSAHQARLPILPVLLHHEAQAVFEWGPQESLPQKIWAMLTSPNPHVHYHVFDPIAAQDFASAESLQAACEQQMLAYQARYLS